MYWVAWDKVCKPKKEGGLVIKNLELFNIVLLSKWKWRTLMDGNASWKGLIMHIYSNFSSLFLNSSVVENYGDPKDLLWWHNFLIFG